MADAVPLAQALVAGGVRVLEVTLRTGAALESIAAIAEVPDAIVGAGTVLTRAQLAGRARPGCRFAVSPGATPALLDAAEAVGLPLLPAAADRQRGDDPARARLPLQKLFPAEPSGGVRCSRAWPRPCPQSASARPAASTPRRRRPTWRCPTWSASAARGWCPRPRSRPATGPGSSSWRPRRWRSSVGLESNTFPLVSVRTRRTPQGASPFPS